MKVELGDVVTAQLTTQLAEVGCVKELIERPVNQLSTAGGLELRPPAGRCLGDKPLQLGRLGIEPVTGAGQPLKALDDPAFPAGDILDKALKDQRGALAPPIEDRARHVHAA